MRNIDPLRLMRSEAVNSDASAQWSGPKESRGFTLIEMMIVVTIVGVLAALTLPIFTNYMLKVKAGRLLAELEAPKLVVAENWQAGGELCSSPRSPSVGCNSGSGELQNTGVSGATNITVKLTPTASGGVLLWSCEVTPPEAAPKACVH